MTSSKGTLESGGDIGRVRGCGWRCELVVVISDCNAGLEGCDQVWVRIHCVEAANDRPPTRILLRKVLQHPVRNVRIGKGLANASELLICNGKVLEVVLNWPPEVWMTVQELLGVMRSQSEVLHLESA